MNFRTLGAAVAGVVTTAVLVLGTQASAGAASPATHGGGSGDSLNNGIGKITHAREGWVYKGKFATKEACEARGRQGLANGEWIAWGCAFSPTGDPQLPWFLGVMAPSDRP